MENSYHANVDVSEKVTQPEERGFTPGIPHPKYSIGDVVFWPNTVREIELLSCPDCLGTKEWKVVTPAGTELKTKCQRCEPGGFRDLPRPERVVWKPTVERRTIGSIRIDTAASSYRSPVEYMCRETGIGSGTVYDEGRLFPTEEAAMAWAAADAAENTAKEDAKPKSIETVKLSHIRVLDAVLDEAWKQRWDAWYAYRRLSEDVERCVDESSDDTPAERLEALTDALNWERKYREIPGIGVALAKLREAVQMTPELEAVFATLERPAPDSDDRTESIPVA